MATGYAARSRPLGRASSPTRGSTPARSGSGARPREYNSYTGAYAFDGATLTTRVDGATELARVGGDQVRAVRFEDGKLILNSPRRPRHGMLQDHELAWERIG
jgi:hypothetical protein